MRIPNKFNGYSRDGLRRYNDPVSAGLVASGTGALGGAATVATGIGALETGLTAGALLAGGGGGLLGELGLSAIGAPALGGLSGAATPAIAAEIAPAALAQATGTIAPSIAQSAGLDALKQQALQGGLSQATPTIEQMGAKFLANSPPLAKEGIAQTLLADASNKVIPESLIRPGYSGWGSYPGVDGLTKVTQLPDVANLSNTVATTTPSLSTTPVAEAITTPQTTGNLAETLRNASTSLRGEVPISYAEGAQGIAPNAAAAPPTSPIQPGQGWMDNLGNFLKNPSWQAAKDYAKEHPYATAAGAYGLYKAMQPKYEAPPTSPGLIRPYTYDRTQRAEAYNRPSSDTSERLYFNDKFTALTPYEAPGPEYKRAGGGIVSLAVGGPVERMAAMNAVGANTGYPQAGLQTPLYSNPAIQRPEATNVIAPSADAGVNVYTGEARFAEGGDTDQSPGYKYSYDPKTLQFTQLSRPVEITPPAVMSQWGPSVGNAPTWGSEPTNITTGGIAPPTMGPMPMQQAAPVNIPAYQTPEQQLGLGGFYDYMNRQLGGYGGYAAGGGVSTLGGYSDGGRLLKGPGDGVSDSIPASIGNRQPARLADGEFVVPARIVSELGNGSTEAGARKLYAMMDRVQNARKKSVGKDKVAVNSKADKYLPV